MDGTVCADGTCSYNCPPEQVICDGRCVTLELFHLTDCESCEEGFGNLNHTWSDGCESEINKVTTCGLESVDCTKNVKNADAVCIKDGSDYVCDYTSCNNGYGDCNGDRTNGCETDLNNNASHCGQCGDVVPMYANADASCVLGKPVMTCKSNYGDCDGELSNGCETNLNSDDDHCGACNSPVPNYANASGECVSGSPKMTCYSNYADCNNKTSDGCETNLNTSSSHCGSCGNAISGSYANGSASCVNGKISLSCSSGYGNCDGNISNGCETNLNTSSSHCGSCGNAISGSYANGSASCVNGKISLSCSSGYGNCDGNISNGCETNLNTSSSHCGSCGNAISDSLLIGSTFSCVNGQITLTCSSGFGDCDGNISNGCEAALKLDEMNCGSCGSKCLITQTCKAGTCTKKPVVVPGCSSGHYDCYGDGTKCCPDKSYCNSTDGALKCLMMVVDKEPAIPIEP